METMHCPYCDELISVNAKKCKHCGEWLDEEARQRAMGTTTNATQQPKSGVNFTGDAETIIRQVLSAKYEIIEVIGKGGMATVYKAKQKSLDRIVALKVIHLNLIHDEEFLRRFHREAELGSSLNHPNIVHVYDVGDEGDVHYMAMEYLEGEDLHKKIKRKGKLSEEEAISYIVPIAEALGYAHKKGLVHRDIKSGNIIITKEGRAVLTDFGIAHAVSGTKLTKTGTVIGTPEYMSPEQAEGREIDGRSDIYSLGVVLYECLTGKVPFRGDNPLTTIHKIIYEPLPDIRRVEGISEAMAEVIKKALAKERSERIQSGEEFANLLRKVKEGKEVKIEGKEKELEVKQEPTEKTIKIDKREAEKESAREKGEEEKNIKNSFWNIKSKKNFYLNILIITLINIFFGFLILFLYIYSINPSKINITLFQASILCQIPISIVYYTSGILFIKNNLIKSNKVLFTLFVIFISLLERFLINIYFVPKQIFWNYYFSIFFNFDEFICFIITLQANILFFRGHLLYIKKSSEQVLKNIYLEDKNRATIFFILILFYIFLCFI